MTDEVKKEIRWVQGLECESNTIKCRWCFVCAGKVLAAEVERLSAENEKHVEAAANFEMNWHKAEQELAALRKRLELAENFISAYKKVRLDCDDGNCESCNALSAYDAARAGENI